MSEEDGSDEDDMSDYDEDEERDYFSVHQDDDEIDESEPLSSYRFPKFIIDAIPDQLVELQEHILRNMCAELRLLLATPVSFWSKVLHSPEYGNTSGMKLLYMTVRMRGKSTSSVEGFNKLLTLLFGGADYGGAAGMAWCEDQLRLKFNSRPDEFDPEYYLKYGYLRMAGLMRVRSMHELAELKKRTGRTTVGTAAQLARGRRYRARRKERGEVYEHPRQGRRTARQSANGEAPTVLKTRPPKKPKAAKPPVITDGERHDDHADDSNQLIERKSGMTIPESRSRSRRPSVDRDSRSRSRSPIQLPRPHEQHDDRAERDRTPVARASGSGDNADVAHIPFDTDDRITLTQRWSKWESARDAQLMKECSGRTRFESRSRSRSPSVDHNRDNSSRSRSRSPSPNRRPRYRDNSSRNRSSSQRQQQQRSRSPIQRLRPREKHDDRAERDSNLVARGSKSGVLADVVDSPFATDDQITSNQRWKNWESARTSEIVKECSGRTRLESRSRSRSPSVDHNRDKQQPEPEPEPEPAIARPLWLIAQYGSACTLWSAGMRQREGAAV